MIELQILNKILADKSLAFCQDNNIEADMFTTYKAEFSFIQEHKNEYGNIPDVETFLAEFNDFDVMTVSESEKYLIEKLREEYTYTKMVPFVRQLADKVTEDSVGAVDFLKRHIDELNNLSAAYKEGYDIIKNAEERGDDYKFRLEAEGLLGITTGLNELDEITYGWLKEDFIVIAGRTNEGKSWVLMFFLVAAWMAKVPVLMYSGEMSKDTVGKRFDTLKAHFSHSALMSGSENLGQSEEPKSPEDYYDYLTELTTNETPFVVVTPKDLKGRLTVTKLNTLIEKYKPGIVGIDQLSLMEDDRAGRGEQKRIQQTHIAEDLYLSSEKYGIPILAPVQANRKASEDNKKTTTDDKAPELDQIAEADGIGQNATRVITIKQSGVLMKLALKKNRYGPKDIEVLTLWDIDSGVVRPFLKTTTDGDENNVDSSELTAGAGVDLF